MALQTTLQSPDAATTISFKDEKVIMMIAREPRVRPIPGNNTTAIDMRKATRTFTITGKVTVEGGSAALLQVENMETAAITWAAQTGSNTPTNSSKFTWGNKNDATPKVYFVYIKSLMVSNTPSDTGGAALVFEYTLVLAEVTSPLSTKG